MVNWSETTRPTAPARRRLISPRVVIVGLAVGAVLLIAPASAPAPTSTTAAPAARTPITELGGPPIVATPRTRAATVSAARLNMRATPGPDGAIVATLERGWSVSVTGPGRVVDGWMWLPVSWAGKSGWVSARYVVVIN